MVTTIGSATLPDPGLTPFGKRFGNFPALESRAKSRLFLGGLLLG